MTTTLRTPSTKRNRTPAPDPYSGPLPITLAALLKTKLPPAVPCVWPWLNSGESCLLWGGTGTGKSFVAMTLALGVAGGGEAFGWEFHNPCRVLYVDGEQSCRDLQERFGLLGSSLGEDHDKAQAASNLSIYSRTQGEAGASFFDLSNRDHAKSFVDYLKAHSIGFVIFDNLSTLSDLLKDENDATAFKPMQSLFAVLKAKNIAAVLVHHSGKNPGARFRGSSNIGTTFERIVALYHNDKEPPTVLAARAEIEKYRSKPPPGFSPQVHFRLKTEEGPGGKTVSARWEIDAEQGQLAEGWRMFWGGGFESVAEFVAAFNKRFHARRRPGNFSRDFRVPWERDLLIPAAKIEQAKGFLVSGCDTGARPDF